MEECHLDISVSYGWILVKFCVWIDAMLRKKWVNFGEVLDTLNNGDEEQMIEFWARSKSCGGMPSNISISHEWILVKFCVPTDAVLRKKWVNFGEVLDTLLKKSEWLNFEQDPKVVDILDISISHGWILVKFYVQIDAAKEEVNQFCWSYSHTK